MSTRHLSLFAVLGLGAAGIFGAHAHAAAQTNAQSLGVSAVYQGYDFDDALGIDAAQLLMIPIAYRLPGGDKFSAELYAAWAEGRVKRDGRVSVLNGLVDTRLHFSYMASPWAILTLGVNLPTGNVTHDSEEAVVASVLSSDILGFRESNWGTGTYVTTGVATARRVGSWGLGLGVSYRAADEFEPRSDTSLAYSPGNELRVRVGLDRNVGETGKFTAGFTLQSFQTDEFGGRNLFQSGNRVRVDATYAFRAGSTTWSVSAADVWRAEGDLSQQTLNSSGAVVGESLVATETQNLLFASLRGAIPIRSTLYLRPIVDFRLQDLGTLPGEVDVGGSWILGGGFDLAPTGHGARRLPTGKGERGAHQSAGRDDPRADPDRNLRDGTIPITVPSVPSQKFASHRECRGAGSGVPAPLGVGQARRRGIATRAPRPKAVVRGGGTPQGRMHRCSNGRDTSGTPH